MDVFIAVGKDDSGVCPFCGYRCWHRADKWGGCKHARPAADARTGQPEIKFRQSRLTDETILYPELVGAEKR